MPENSWFFYFLLPAILFGTELIYFRLAVRYRIIDKPNDRSSHLNPVIRGGGVIFFLALLLWFILEGGSWPWFMAGLTFVSLISFMDDLRPQKAGVRFLFHLAGMLLLFYETSIFSWPILLVIPALIVCIGTINAFNFMDGINGITGVYSLVTVGSFFYIERYVFSFTRESLLLTLIISILVFLFFNFRRRAKCFAGDIGSVTLAFAIIFVLLQLISNTGNFVWVLFLLVYGTDSVITIVYRLRNKENIFQAHRTHLYQYLTNEFKYSHLSVSLWYGVLQLAVNLSVILFFRTFGLPTAIFIGSFFGFYIVIREFILKKIGRQGLFMKTMPG